MLKEKFKNMSNKTKGAFAGAVTAVTTFATGALTAFAEGTNEGVSAAQSLLTTAQSTLNITNVVAILSAGIGAVLGLFLAWWGTRKLFNMLKGAITGGKAKL